MASGMAVIREPLIICSICQKSFTDPRVLPCSHSYCLRCIQDVASKNHDQFHCPQNDGTYIDKNQIESLLPNQTIREIMTLTAPPKCFECGKSSPEYWCHDCNDSFCLKCNDELHKLNTMKMHERSSNTCKPPGMIRCSTHRNKILEYWCKTCEKLICNKCKILDDPNHEWLTIDEAAAILKREIELYLRKIQLFSDSPINQADEVINDITTINQLNRTKCAEAISSLHDIVDGHEKFVLEQMSTIQTRQIKTIEKYIQQIQEELKTLNGEKEKLLTIVTTIDRSELQQPIDEFHPETITQLKQLQLPTIVKHQLEGVNELPKLQQKINQFGHFIPYQTSISKLEQLIDSSQGESLNLGWSGLTDQDMKIVTKALQDKQRIVTIDLRDNQISATGARYLVVGLENDGMKSNSILHSYTRSTSKRLFKLYLPNNDVGDIGAQYFGNVLQMLTTLSLSNNNISDEGAQYLAEGLYNNTVLTALYLHENLIGAQGAQHFAMVLLENTTLSILDLCQNHIGDEGAQYLANALHKNKTLTELYLTDNQITGEGAQHLAHCLLNNSTLTVLSIGNNQIGDFGAQDLIQALLKNMTLTRVFLYNNQISNKSQRQMMNIVQRNVNLKVSW